MTLDQAKALATALAAAINHAEWVGAADVDLGAQLRALDDAARAELQAAIDAHG